MRPLRLFLDGFGSYRRPTEAERSRWICYTMRADFSGEPGG